MHSDRVTTCPYTLHGISKLYWVMKFAYWSSMAVNMSKIPVISVLKDRKRPVMSHYWTSFWVQEAEVCLTCILTVILLHIFFTAWASSNNRLTIDQLTELMNKAEQYFKVYAPFTTAEYFYRDKNKIYFDEADRNSGIMKSYIKVWFQLILAIGYIPLSLYLVILCFLINIFDM